MRLETLSDGNLVLPGDFILGGMPQDEMAAIMVRHGLPHDRLTPPCNVTLLRRGPDAVLFDAGAGPDFQLPAGKLMAAFEALGAGVEDITHVVLADGHPDHLWGLLDEFDEPTFPNAEHLMGRAKFAYWTDPAHCERHRPRPRRDGRAGQRTGDGVCKPSANHAPVAT